MEILIAEKENLGLYDWFISPKGDFYIVSEKYKHMPTHYEWADYFVTKETDYIRNLANPSGSFLYTLSRLKSKEDILIHFYGFIYYGHDSLSRNPILIYPNYDINNKEITNFQYDVLWKVLYINDELRYYPCNYVDDEHNKLHDKYVKRYIEKLERRYKNG